MTTTSANTTMPVMPASVATPPNDPDEITHCAACGKPFRGREKWTFAAWFRGGPLTLGDIVHVRCSRKTKRTEPKS